MNDARAVLVGSLVLGGGLGGCQAALDELEQALQAIDRGHAEEPYQDAQPVEALAPPAEEPLPQRPADSTARSETEVITFENILRNEEMSREERIDALLNLDPAALQNRSGAPRPKAVQDQAGGNGPPSEWEVAAARRRVPVVMYATTWCGVCKKARRYFERERISFVEYDVDRNASARAEYLRLNPRRSVPTIQVGEQVIVGFSESSVERALERAARARLD